jgi:hypothetical protein
MNALAQAASPITGAAEAIIGRPVANIVNATGIPQRFGLVADPEAIGNVASMAIPGAGEVAGARELSGAAKAAGVGEEALAANRTAAARALPKAPGPIRQAANALRQTVAPTGTPQERAEQMVVSRIRRDSGRAPTAQEMLDHAERTPNKEMTLMDVGGPSTRGLAGMVVRSPKGEGGPRIQNFLAERSAQQGPRLESDIQQQIGAGSSRQTIRSLTDAQKKAAGPLYDDAFEANPVIRSSVIDQIVRSKQGAPLWKEAQSRARARMVGTDKPIPDKYSLRVMDQLKQLFDDKIGAAKRAGENNTASFYLDIKHRLVNEVDAADKTGLYAKARKTFSDSATSKDAVDFGRNALNMTPEDIADHMRGLSDGDKELARLGVAEALRDRVAATDIGRNAATKLARNRGLQARLAPFFKSPEALQKFIDSATAEDTMFRTENEVVKGSQTAARAAEDSAADARLIGHGLTAAGHLGRGNIPGTMMSAGRGAWEFARRPNPEVGENVANILTAPVSSNDLARMLLQRSASRTGSPRNYLKAAEQRSLASRVPMVAGPAQQIGPQQ